MTDFKGHTADTSPIADDQDWSSLEAWLHREMPDRDGADQPVLNQPMTVRQFTGGHANLTYCVTSDMRLTAPTDIVRI